MQWLSLLNIYYCVIRTRQGTAKLFPDKTWYLAELQEYRLIVIISPWLHNESNIYSFAIPTLFTPVLNGLSNIHNAQNAELTHDATILLIQEMVLYVTVGTLVSTSQQKLHIYISINTKHITLKLTHSALSEAVDLFLLNSAWWVLILSLKTIREL